MVTLLLLTLNQYERIVLGMLQIAGLTLSSTNSATADGKWVRLDGVHVTHEARAGEH